MFKRMVFVRNFPLADFWPALRNRNQMPSEPIGRITSRLAVTWEQAGSLNVGTCITILPELPHLEQQAIPHAAIPNCTNHFSVVDTLGEAVLDLACSIEGLQLFGGEFQI
jgi:hypothetical protein